MRRKNCYKYPLYSLNLIRENVVTERIKNHANNHHDNHNVSQSNHQPQKQACRAACQQNFYHADFFSDGNECGN